MTALVRYLLADFLRSYRYFMPVLLYGVFVPWLYTLKPNPVLGSYAATSAILFGIGVWFALQLLQSEHIRQQDLTVLHAGGRGRYALGKLAALLVCSLPFALYGVFVPLAMRAFDRPVTASDLLLGFISHELAYALGCWISWTALLWFRKANTVYGAALLMVVLSLGAGGLEGLVTGWMSPASWLLPPVYRIIRGLTDYESLGAAGRWLYFGYPAVYIAVGFTIALRLYAKQRA